MSTADQKAARLATIMEELGQSDVPLHHWDDERLVIYVPEVRHYLTEEADGRQWWTNALPITLPSVLSPTQAERICALYSKSGRPGECGGKCPTHARRSVPEPVCDLESEEPDTVV